MVMQYCLPPLPGCFHALASAVLIGDLRPSSLRPNAFVVLVVGAVLHKSRRPNVVIIDHLVLLLAKVTVKLISRIELPAARGALVFDVGRSQLWRNRRVDTHALF